jgi:hypothetical protein
MTVDTYRQNGASVRERLEHGREELGYVRDDFAEIADDLRVLAGKELELMRAEMGEQFQHGTRALMFGGAAAILALVFLTFAFVTVMLVLDGFMPLWAAALVTTAVAFAVAAVAALLARVHLKRITVVPRRTIRSVEEDVQWARRQLRSNAR